MTINVLKHEEYETHYSVLLHDTEKDIKAWMDVAIEEGDVSVEWNAYIFNTNNEKEVALSKYQEDCNNYMAMDSEAVNYLTNKGLIGQYEDSTWYDYKTKREDDEVKRIMNIFENHGFVVKYEEPGYSIQQHTPAGEDWGMCFDTDEDLIEYCKNYDANEDFKIWVENIGKNGVPSIDVLYEDAKWKQSIIDNIYDCILGNTTYSNKGNEMEALTDYSVELYLGDKLPEEYFEDEVFEIYQAYDKEYGNILYYIVIYHGSKVKILNSEGECLLTEHTTTPAITFVKFINDLRK